MSEPIDPKLAEVMAERDAYRKALLALLRKDMEFWHPTREELDEMEANGLTFDDLTAEVERVVQEPGRQGNGP